MPVVGLVPLSGKRQYRLWAAFLLLVPEAGSFIHDLEEKRGLTLNSVQGDPYGHGKDYVDIKFKVLSQAWVAGQHYSSTQLQIWSQHKLFRDHKGHPVMDGANDLHFGQTILGTTSTHDCTWQMF